jgi:hypothetical protein
MATYLCCRCCKKKVSVVTSFIFYVQRPIFFFFPLAEYSPIWQIFISPSLPAMGQYMFHCLLNLFVKSAGINNEISTQLSKNTRQRASPDATFLSPDDKEDDGGALAGTEVEGNPGNFCNL